ncbi:MAG: stage V sporulation protein AD [Clostridiales bacterium]|jgi:stage V sporulation protein AD|nr:stage V sporulation protein AD [Clostridiales bacterium]
MPACKRKGERTVFFERKPHIVSAASIVGDMEGAGPLGALFDKILQDDTWGESSWEKAESKMFEAAARMALDKTGLSTGGLHCLLGGDLLNQLITANYAARELSVPFFGLYSACATLTEALLLAGMLIEGGFLGNAACVASSHFSAAERQFRYPLEMGVTAPPTAQRTVTGAGALVLRGDAPSPCDPFQSVCVAGGTIGRVVDMGITDMSNMGAAMAPAAADTLRAHLRDSGKSLMDYDAVITGDLGKFGTKMLIELCDSEGLHIEEKHMDCGNLIFAPGQGADCGGSGCGCAPVVLGAHLLQMLEDGIWNRILFLATGALMSPVSNLQGESIPGIAHAVILERVRA